jgi:hypothetical protein
MSIKVIIIMMTNIVLLIECIYSLCEIEANVFTSVGIFESFRRFSSVRRVLLLLLLLLLFLFFACWINVVLIVWRGGLN